MKLFDGIKEELYEIECIKKQLVICGCVLLICQWLEEKRLQKKSESCALFIFDTKLSLFLLKQKQKDNLRMLSYFSANFLSF